MYSILIGRTTQDPKRVIVALEKGGRLEAAVTVHDGKDKPLAVQRTVERWRDVYGVELHPRLWADVHNVPLFYAGDGESRVSLCMCARGKGGCHRVVLNLRPLTGMCDEMIHEADHVYVRRQLEGWARQLGFGQDQTFWFLASALSRLEELSHDDTLDWYKSGVKHIFI